MLSAQRKDVKLGSLVLYSLVVILVPKVTGQDRGGRKWVHGRGLRSASACLVTVQLDVDLRRCRIVEHGSFITLAWPLSTAE